MKVIELTQGQVAIVDDEDFEKLAQYRWHLTRVSKDMVPYAARNSKKGELPKRRLIKMHRVIMNPPEGMEVDHINRNGLDNRRCNLRLCTKSQNLMNAKVRKDNKLGIKGVCFVDGKYMAHVTINRKSTTLGFFNTPEEAKSERDAAAQKLHGEFYSSN